MKQSFGADVTRVLKLVIHSIYTNKDIFIRELLSNSSDALEKLRYKTAVNQDNVIDIKGEFEINLKIDKDLGVIIFRDNGIGMSESEMIENLGTIAKSGTGDFLEEALKDVNKKSADLIGQFGVGFYSAFMISDKVEVKSRRYDSQDSFLWHSDGIDSFFIEKLDENIDIGTEIKVFVKEEYKDLYLDKFKVENVIKTYSNHISFPIYLQYQEEGKILINDSRSIWLRNKSEITNEEYVAFYKSLSYFPSDPLLIIHHRAEGRVEFVGLFFIPDNKPLDMFHPDRNTKIKLYIKKVFISEATIDIIPKYLRFIYGVVDSDDLPLNISRESIQTDQRISKIKDVVTNKVHSELKDLLSKDRIKYEKFWNNFGPVFKEGLCESNSSREDLLSLTLFKTTKSSGFLISFEEYISRMPAEQKEIYYFIGEKYEDMMSSPELEVFIKNHIEVILFIDVVDSFWINVIHDYKGKDLKSILNSDLDLSNLIKNELSDNEKEGNEEKKASDAKIVQKFADVLGKKVCEVKVSKKLIDSPACLSIRPGSMDIKMERFLLEQNQISSKTLKVLEINTENDLVKHANELLNHTSDGDKKIGSEIVEAIFELACISQGESIENPSIFAKRIYSLMIK